MIALLKARPLSVHYLRASAPGAVLGWLGFAGLSGVFCGLFVSQAEYLLHERGFDVSYETVSTPVGKRFRGRSSR
jgi:hypothetical protein